MKKILLFLLLLCAFQTTGFASYTHGYMRRNGTFVQGYNRSNPNMTVRDNYSYRGNVNPFNGIIGSNKYRNNPTSEYYNPTYQPRRRNGFSF